MLPIYVSMEMYKHHIPHWQKDQYNILYDQQYYIHNVGVFGNIMNPQNNRLKWHKKKPVLQCIKELCLLTKVTRWVPLVEQELFTLPEHTSLSHGFYWRSCCSIFSFYVVLFWPLYCISFDWLSFKLVSTTRFWNNRNNSILFLWGTNISYCLFRQE